MQCVSCGGEMSANFISAIKNNQCPACGQAMLDKMEYKKIFALTKHLKMLNLGFNDDLLIKLSAAINSRFELWPKGEGTAAPQEPAVSPAVHVAASQVQHTEAVQAKVKENPLFLEEEDELPPAAVTQPAVKSAKPKGRVDPHVAAQQRLDRIKKAVREETREKGGRIEEDDGGGDDGEDDGGADLAAMKRDYKDIEPDHDLLGALEMVMPEPKKLVDEAGDRFSHVRAAKAQQDNRFGIRGISRLGSDD